MKIHASLLLAIVLLAARAHAETATAESAEFPVETGSARSVAAVTSAEFPVDVRMMGGVASEGSPEFAVNTMGFVPGALEVSGPQTVVAGGGSAFQLYWHAGSTWLDVTQMSGCRFLTAVPGGTTCGSGVFHAGDVPAPTTVQMVFRYLFRCQRPQPGERAVLHHDHAPAARHLDRLPRARPLGQCGVLRRRRDGQHHHLRRGLGP